MRHRQPRTILEITHDRTPGARGPLGRAMTQLVNHVGGPRAAQNGLATPAPAAGDLAAGDARPSLPVPPAETGEPCGRLSESGARLLLVASDRRFRAMALVLLSRRGYQVAVGHPDEDVTELASRESAEVVVFDATASLTVAARQAERLNSLVPPIGIVAVSGNPQDQLATMPVISKWNSFDALLDAIEQARRADRNGGLTSGTV
jgi:hypothetical protein